MTQVLGAILQQYHCQWNQNWYSCKVVFPRGRKNTVHKITATALRLTNRFHVAVHLFSNR